MRLKRPSRWISSQNVTDWFLLALALLVCGLDVYDAHRLGDPRLPPNVLLLLIAGLSFLNVLGHVTEADDRRARDG